MKNYVAANILGASEDICKFICSKKLKMINQYNDEVGNNRPLKFNPWFDCNYDKLDPLDEGVDKDAFKGVSIAIYSSSDIE